MPSPEHNQFNVGPEETLWNHVADRKQGGDPVASAYCAAQPPPDTELAGLLTLADAVQSALRRESDAQDHAGTARARLAAVIAADLPAPNPAPRQPARVRTSWQFLRRRPALALAMLLLLLSVAGAIAYQLAQSADTAACSVHSAAVSTAGQSSAVSDCESPPPVSRSAAVPVPAIRPLITAPVSRSAAMSAAFHNCVSCHKSGVPGAAKARF